MSTARIECVGGASGNMLLGALIDAGLEITPLEQALRRLPLPAFGLAVEQVVRRGVRAVHVEVRAPEERDARHLPDITAIIAQAALPSEVRHRAIAVFERLADAEARVHGISRDEVHFHEVGAVDAIVDVVGVVLGLSMLGVEAIGVSPLPVGTGSIRCAHGEMPNPAPATAELLRGWPLRFTDIPGELVTPTGAALLTTLGRFDLPHTTETVERIGYGAGTRDSDHVANVLRLIITNDAGGGRSDSVVRLEACIDDMNPQIFGHVTDRLFEEGALDVFITPVLMKKGRPANQITALSPTGLEDRLLAVLFEETTTIGVRVQPIERRLLPREQVCLQTSLGEVRFKIAGEGGRARPEYDDCRRIARERSIPLIDVLDRVRAEGEAALRARAHED